MRAGQWAAGNWEQIEALIQAVKILSSPRISLITAQLPLCWGFIFVPRANSLHCHVWLAWASHQAPCSLSDLTLTQNISSASLTGSTYTCISCTLPGGTIHTTVSVLCQLTGHPVSPSSLICMFHRIGPTEGILGFMADYGRGNFLTG